MRRTITLELATVPNVPNKNGYKYTEEAFNKAISSDRLQELINTGSCYVEVGRVIYTLRDGYSIDPAISCGSIKSISTGSVDMTVINEELFSLIKDPVCALVYTGQVNQETKTVYNMSIIKLVILERNMCYTR